MEVGIAGDVGAGGPGPFYVEVIVPDEQKFFQGKKIVMRLGKLFGWRGEGSCVIDGRVGEVVSWVVKRRSGRF